jgi:hypothetical protein
LNGFWRDITKSKAVPLPNPAVESKYPPVDFYRQEEWLGFPLEDLSKEVITSSLSDFGVEDLIYSEQPSLTLDLFSSHTKPEDK